MHADGKSTLVSVSKWNSGKVNWLLSFTFEQVVYEKHILAHTCPRLDIISGQKDTEASIHDAAILLA